MGSLMDNSCFTVTEALMDNSCLTMTEALMDNSLLTLSGTLMDYFKSSKKCSVYLQSLKKKLTLATGSTPAFRSSWIFNALTFIIHWQQ